MIKTILIIIISVAIFGLIIFVLVRNALKRKIDQLVEEEKNQIILINFGILPVLNLILFLINHSQIQL